MSEVPIAGITIVKADNGFIIRSLFFNEASLQLICDDENAVLTNVKDQLAHMMTEAEVAFAAPENEKEKGEEKL